MTNIKELDHCPKCGGNTGYYTKVYASGWLYHYTDFEGNEENCGLHDSLRYSRESKYYYCYDCDKPIAKKE